MSAGVVIRIDTAEDFENWNRLLLALKISELYELPGLGQTISRSIKIESLRDLVNYHAADLVVVQPRDGDFVQGEIPLQALQHPPEALYVFGGTMTRLTTDDLRNVLAQRVFIPVGDLYPDQAAAMVLWDRIQKRGEL